LDGEISKTQVASEHSKMLLDQLRNKQITKKEFLTKCAYWALEEGFDELTPRMLPTKPSRVMDLEAKRDVKTDVDWSKTYSDYPEVRGYYERTKEVEAWNKSTKEWLEEMLSYIPKEDVPAQTKIKDRLTLFNQEDATVAKAKEVFDAHSA
jgi:hypothetical protein